MENIELTILVNKVNTGRVKQVGTAHGGSLDDRTYCSCAGEGR